MVEHYLAHTMSYFNKGSESILLTEHYLAHTMSYFNKRSGSMEHAIEKLKGTSSHSYNVLFQQKNEKLTIEGKIINEGSKIFYFFPENTV